MCIFVRIDPASSCTKSQSISFSSSCSLSLNLETPRDHGLRSHSILLHAEAQLFLSPSLPRFSGLSLFLHLFSSQVAAAGPVSIFFETDAQVCKKNWLFYLSYLLLMCFRLLRRSTRSSAASAGSGIIGHSGHDFVTFHASLVTLCRCRTSVDSCVLVHVPREGLQAGCVEFRHFSNL